MLGFLGDAPGHDDAEGLGFHGYTMQPKRVLHKLFPGEGPSPVANSTLCTLIRIGF
jgi:hypothetical protein